MFPRAYFPAGAFAPTYFPPVVGVTPPVPIIGYVPVSDPVPWDWLIEQDDEELMFWII
jgi:hypothetical protein